MIALKGLEPWLQPYAAYLLQVAAANGLNVQITSVRRSRQQQAALYARYLRGESDLPAAPPGTSDHELGLAFDLVVDHNYHSVNQERLGRFWQSMGGRWAGDADRVHFYVR